MCLRGKYTGVAVARQVEVRGWSVEGEQVGKRVKGASLWRVLTSGETRAHVVGQRQAEIRACRGETRRAEPPAALVLELREERAKRIW